MDICGVQRTETPARGLLKFVRSDTNGGYVHWATGNLSVTLLPPTLPRFLHLCFSSSFTISVYDMVLGKVSRTQRTTGVDTSAAQCVYVDYSVLRLLMWSSFKQVKSLHLSQD